MENKVLFITGGAGFIGSNFINIFCKTNPNTKVINFDALYYCANENNVEKEIRDSSNYQFINGNLQSYDLLKYIFESNSITHIIHFAAQSHVQNSFTDSIQYTKDNVLGTHNLLEVTRLFCPTLERFIHCSTDEVYGESMLEVDEQHKTEQSVLCPTNPYAASKAAAEMLVNSYNHSFNMPFIITRGNNVYGPNQYPEKVIPRFIKQLKNGEKVTIQGDGSCVRAFLHAYDTANAFITVLEKGKIGEIYNIGCDEGMEYSIMDVAKILIKRIHLTEDYSKWITYIEDRPFNDKRYFISNQKLRDLGWNIDIGFEEGLDLLINKNIVLIMAGGLGKRMNSELPKVLHLLKGKPLIVHVIETALKINPIKIGIIVGKYRDIIEKTVGKYLKDISKIEYIIQPTALGTGHAIMCCKDFLSNYKNSSVTILSGDVPLIKSETLEKLNTSLNKCQAAILINKLDNPHGYGRIIVDRDQFVKIVEEKDCNDIERKVDFVNSGIYSFKCRTIVNNISKITNNNKQNEYYLTDIFNFIDKKLIELEYLENKYEVMGVNTSQQLIRLETIS
ncbi:dTDP-D-glucose 4,6-dehydratase/N-acetylglucosamine-1-phosphate urydiltransferase fusion protein [Chrysochromulina ericina virus CeV-01B]|uniref:dTDP-D-glucose 4,6-dehydratase/N-acetylglucosamine-1-phosphate urydiltransferase fusion protein n=1 Tax=Chrysochromulina ericina virus CeV-01B TaxID=3070830 RepID=A0A0N7G7I9_9VIRU|nr:nucleotide-sugar epimerase [Chrysochromulina ericina virus]ALH22913.1 dTDP-D-glucose 4,6-dehydratase/N-acetylglucosamine-1-phosphate urydiltransferase fusion protein [Chrysochromulina ericina virus CeV-01B]